MRYVSRREEIKRTKQKGKAITDRGVAMVKPFLPSPKKQTVALSALDDTMISVEEMKNQNFLDCLSYYSNSLPNKAVYSFLDDHGKVVRAYTYSELDTVTRHLASVLLAEKGCKPNDRVLLVYPPGLDFIVAFISCLRAGLIAVPVYPPRPGVRKEVQMFISIQKDSNANIVLTNSLYKYAKKIETIKQKITFASDKVAWPSDLTWFVTDSAMDINKADSDSANKYILPSSFEADKIAFLQYTSGSTSQPKGVEITHSNLTHNLSCIIIALKASEATVVTSWLPQYHDMGLIGSYLGVLYCGGSGYYLSPISFIKNPVVWLQAASMHKATHLQAPNFAYKLTVRKFIEKLAKENIKLDLSNVQHVFDAAEPIDYQSMDSFLSTFGKYGLSKNALVPGYGLAEHTVYVCDGGTQRLCIDKVLLEKDNTINILDMSVADDKSKAVVLVGCGRPDRCPEFDISCKIVDYKTCQVLGEDVVGEIWISSPSKSNGYYNMPDKSKSDLHAKLSPPSGADVNNDKLYAKEWLRSGDLGFMHKGELFICGRLKDLIIIRGRNHYPQDIEFTVENCNDSVRAGCIAAFTVPHEGEELLVVVSEVRDAKSKSKQELDAIINSVKKGITVEHGLSPYAIALVTDRTIPKTTSGKISRHRVKLAYQNGNLSVISQRILEAHNDSEVAETSAEASKPKTVAKTSSKPVGSSLLGELKDEIARLLEMDTSSIDENTPLIELGMDSMALTQFRGILQNSYNTDIEESDLFDESTSLNTIVSKIQGGAAGVGSNSNGNSSTVSAPVASAAKPVHKQKHKKKSKLCQCILS